MGMGMFSCGRKSRVGSKLTNVMDQGCFDTMSEVAKVVKPCLTRPIVLYY